MEPIPEARAPVVPELRRLHGDGKAEDRTASERDCDRVLYSSAFQRLGAVTQVAPAGEAYLFHSRLNHSLKVAQVARRLTERFQRQKNRPQSAIDLDPDAAEAAALAHDLGHPPFGHIAEDELDALAEKFGGFEGNAQSFRIVTHLARRSLSYPGLNLTRRTLNGLLKYPWMRDPNDPLKNSKWGAYRDDEDAFEFARELSDGVERSIEAEIMDWSDDLSYAVHDLDDFFRAGLLPLDRLAHDQQELDLFLNSFFEDGVARTKLRGRLARQADPEVQSNPTKLAAFADDLIAAATELLQKVLLFPAPYEGMPLDRIRLRETGSGLITRYIKAPQLVDRSSGTPTIAIDQQLRAEVVALKELTWFYVIDRPSLATVQQGQRQIINDLYELFTGAVDRDQFRLFPPRVIQHLRAAQTTKAQYRVVVDYISAMTESTASDLWGRISGVAPGSITDLSLR